MYEDLIKEIEGYVESCESTSVIPSISSVIDIIKEAEPPILDKPLEEGWYWVIWGNPKLDNYGDKECKEVITNQFGNLEIKDGQDVYSLRYSFFKWQKIPEPKWSPVEIDRSEPEYVIVAKDTAESEV